MSLVAPSPRRSSTTIRCGVLLVKAGAQHARLVRELLFQSVYAPVVERLVDVVTMSLLRMSLSPWV